MGDRIAAAARALAGTRYRREGRSHSGVDCLGLVLLAMAGAGRALPPDAADHANGRSVPAIEARLRTLRFAAVEPGARRAGDIVLTAPAAGQLHFLIVTDAGAVEAHAGLRRVVERPWRSDEPVLSVWRAA